MAHGRITSPVNGPELRKLREHKGYNLRDLAQIAGISDSQISKIEREICVPRPNALVRLAAALDVDPQDLCRKEAA